QLDERVSDQTDVVYDIGVVMLGSSVDSSDDQNARPVRWQRAMPTPLVSAKTQAASRSKNRVSFSLQVPDEGAPSSPPAAARALYPSRGGQRAPRPLVVAISAALGTILFLAGWVALILQASNAH